MNPDDPAFPHGRAIEWDANGCATAFEAPSGGLTIRAYFAAKALPGVLAQWAILSDVVLRKRWFTIHEPMAELDEEWAAERAVRYADALIAELNK